MAVDPFPPLLILLAVVLACAGVAVVRWRTRLLLASVGAVGLLVGVYFVPVWWMAATAETKNDAYRVAEAYMARGGYNFANPQAAARWYRIAASQGHIEAQFEIGYAYLIGRGVPRSVDRAQFWMRKAAENGHPHATAYLEGRLDL